MTIHANLEMIADPFQGILLDAYGVFWGGNSIGPLPGSKEMMEKLIQQGKIIGILSNATQPAKKEIEKIAAHGLIQGIHFHFFITSGDVTRALFLEDTLPFPTPRKKYYLLGTPHPNYASHQVVFHGTPYTETPHITEADFIYLAVPHINGQDQTNPALFRQEVEKLQQLRRQKLGSTAPIQDLPMICANPDRFAQEGNPPRAVVRQGSIANIYEELGGHALYIGKPSAGMYAAAMTHFSSFGITDQQQVLMVGDTPETDIRGARNYGMPSALVLNTGIFAEKAAHFSIHEILAQLDPLEQPNFFIERMGK